jgi:FkbM family methyltransferase
MTEKTEANQWHDLSGEEAASFHAANAGREPIDLSASIYEPKEARAVSQKRDGGDLFSRARMQWQFGDWDSLRKLDLLQIEHHPERADLALFAGCAALQAGEKAQARTYLASCVEWGCDRRLIFQLLVSGIYNTLGRFNALVGKQEKEQRFFEFAGRGLGGDPRLIGEVRRQRELLSLPEPHLDKTTGHLLAGKNSAEHEEAWAALVKTLPVSSAEAEAETATSYPQRPEIRSYAQNFEDVMLWRALGDVENGFYIDIGAQHPVIDSVSKAFYEKGWRGIHVEATHAYAQLLRQDRPDEIVIEAAVSDEHGSITFYEIPESGLSTGDTQIATAHRQKGQQVKEALIRTITLADVFALAGDRVIHWLKIDVEGMEMKVVQGWGESHHRPWLLIIESTLPNSRTIVEWEWLKMVNEKGYEKVYFDGVSSFFVHSSQIHLAKYFASGVNLYDDFKLSKMGASGKYV